MIGAYDSIQLYSQLSEIARPVREKFLRLLTVPIAREPYRIPDHEVGNGYILHLAQVLEGNGMTREQAVLLKRAGLERDYLDFVKATRIMDKIDPTWRQDSHLRVSERVGNLERNWQMDFGYTEESPYSSSIVRRPDSAKWDNVEMAFLFEWKDAVKFGMPDNVISNLTLNEAATISRAVLSRDKQILERILDEHRPIIIN